MTDKEKLRLYGQQWYELNKERVNKYRREKYRARRDDWFAENGPCQHCGSWENLELDHVDRLQKVSHKIFGWREERRLPELVKCQALCHECHVLKSVAELGRKYREHGSLTMYHQWKCRCDICREANTEYTRKYRLRKKKEMNYA